MPNFVDFEYNSGCLIVKEDSRELEDLNFGVVVVFVSNDSANAVVDDRVVSVLHKNGSTLREL
jgi:hypothetical protein